MSLNPQTDQAAEYHSPLVYELRQDDWCLRCGQHVGAAVHHPPPPAGNG